MFYMHHLYIHKKGLKVVGYLSLLAQHSFAFHSGVYTVKKKVFDFPVSSRDVTYQTLPAGNNFLIISGQREFGK